MTAENWSWPSAATGRPWWSNKLEGQKMLLQWEKALLDHGKTYQEIFDIRALGPKIAEMQHVLEGVGVIWPPGLTEMAMYYRSADYILLEGEISYGKARPIPSKLPMIPKGEVLPFVHSRTNKKSWTRTTKPLLVQPSLASPNRRPSKKLLLCTNLGRNRPMLMVLRSHKEHGLRKFSRTGHRCETCQLVWAATMSFRG